MLPCELHGARLSSAPMKARDSSQHNVSKSSAAAGIGFMLLASLMFSANDAMGKWLVATYSVGQLLLIRSIAALIVLAPLIYRQGWTPFASTNAARAHKTNNLGTDPLGTEVVSSADSSNADSRIECQGVELRRAAHRAPALQ